MARQDGTLLKLITQNFIPTQGTVEVNGPYRPCSSASAFIRSSPATRTSRPRCNGLDSKDFKEALEDVIDFVELGDFLHQPMKTYSLGMQRARSVRCSHRDRVLSILIIDEVLGAGDAYFAAKSAHRMECFYVPRLHFAARKPLERADHGSLQKRAASSCSKAV